MMKLTRQHAQSSAFTSLAYNDLDGVLEVVFCRGGIYEFIAVSQAQYEHLQRAVSQGDYFNREIRSKHRHRKVRD